MKPAGIKSIARSFVITLMFTAVAVCAPGALKDKDHGNPHKQGKNGKVRQVRSENGPYTIRIVGFYRGTTTHAQVDEEHVAFSVNVTAPDGTTGLFATDSLTIDGPYFTGTATVNGQTATVRGRLDAAKASRLIATYHIPNVGSGRIVGTNPEDKGDDKWND